VSRSGSQFALGGRRRPAPQAARPFDAAVDRFARRIEHVSHLVGAESEDVARDKRGERARRQELQCGDEGQRHGFGLFVAGLRAEWHVDRALEEAVGDTAGAIRLRRAGSARAVLRWARPTPWPGSAGRATGLRGTGWLRSRTARCGARRVPRNLRCLARRPAACPAARPRRPRGIRACGSGAPAVPDGAASQLAKRVATLSPRPGDQAGCHDSSLGCPTVGPAKNIRGEDRVTPDANPLFRTHSRAMRISGSKPLDGGITQLDPRVTHLALPAHLSMDTGRAANSTARARPVRRRGGVCICER
jgi:hypothetical protein